MSTLHRVTICSGIQGRDGYILGLESDLNRFQVVQTAQQQSGAGQKRQRKGDLTRYERLEGAAGDRFRPSEALRSTAAAGGFYARFGTAAAAAD